MGATKRGKAIEEILSVTEYNDWWYCGKEMNGYFPVVDFQKDLEVVSLKTIDPRSASYANGKADAKIMDYMDDLKRSEITIGDDPNVTKILDVRVPKNTKQMLDIDELEKYAIKNEITIEIKEF